MAEDKEQEVQEGTKENEATAGDGASIGDHFNMDGDINLEAIYDIPVEVSAVLGRSQIQVSQLLKLGRGAIVELDKKVGEPVDIFVNNSLVARGEIVIVDNKIGITMTEIMKPNKH